MRVPFAAVREFLSIRHRTVGAAALRITLGLNMLVLYVMHFPERQFIWGDNGVLPLHFVRILIVQSRSWSLYTLTNSLVLHAAVFWAGMLVSVLFVVGIAPRLMSILFFVVTSSLYARNPVLMDGGDNILVLLAFFLMFVDTSGRYVPWRRGDAGPQNPFIALLHNVGICAVVLQICILYFTSGWAKMSGHMWDDGTAIYYILRNSSFNMSPLNAIITQNPVLETVLTYATLVLQVGFPFAVWNRFLKWPWLVGAFIFHLGIGFSMGLLWFSVVMMSCESIFIDDRSYANGRALILSLAAAAEQRMRGLRTRRQLAPIESGGAR